MDIDSYREHIKRLASERVGEAVYNGSADHAAVIVENLFASAQARVCILTGDLEAKVYGASRVVERARQFLGHSDRCLDILLEDLSISPSHPLIEEIGNDANVSFFKVPKQLSDDIGYHLMTADDDCFRFEREKNSSVAVAAFGDADTTKHLNQLFCNIKSRCVRLDIKDVIGR